MLTDYWQNLCTPPHPQCCACSTVSNNRPAWTTKIMCIWILITYYMRVSMKTLIEKQGKSDSLCFISGCQRFIKRVQSHWLTCNTSHIWQTTNINIPAHGATTVTDGNVIHRKPAQKSHPSWSGSSLHQPLGEHYAKVWFWFVGKGN